MTLQSLGGVLAYPAMVSGNNSAFDTSGTVVDAAGEGVAVIFRAPATGSITELAFRTAVVTVGGNIDVRLETVDASSLPAVPSGTLVNAADGGSRKVIAVADGDDNVWKTGTLEAAASVTKGDLLAVVAVADSGFAGNLNLAAAYGPVPQQTRDSDVYALRNMGSWIAFSKILTFRVVYSGGVYHEILGSVLPGDPSTIPFNSTDTPDEIGVIFQVPFPCRVMGAWVHVDLDGDATLKLYGPSTLSVSLDKDVRYEVSTGVHVVTFSTTVNLAKDTDYRLALLPGVSDVKLGELTVDAAAQLGQISMGTKVYRTSRTDAGGWTDLTTGRPSMGILIDQLDDGAGGGGLLTHPGMTGGIRG